eukprot:TRINITY_DN1328_c0_g1_i18.p1 TRINITY_DN1328_c0_g1~~TRINITY_DN1328_c0_g1_i18.p1  ORF type:complete len:319 (-),score=60.68 TRINITY_DN1328_c0_g1_i18:117-1073(-)
MGSASSLWLITCRSWNEDRVTIVYPVQELKGVKGAYFGVYDGHGGSWCANYLRDNLHKLIFADSAFPTDIKKALKNGFEKAEREILRQVVSVKKVEKAGSCAAVVMVVDKKIYIANLGDSRVVCSKDHGNVMPIRTKDHKPSKKREKKRIEKAGGESRKTVRGNEKVGPVRVFPSGLAVSRTFGDAYAKLESLGAKQGVISSEPDVTCFDLAEDLDFLVIGSDGIFDKLKSRKVIRTVFDNIEQESTEATIHLQSAKAVEAIVQAALKKKSLDNLSAVFIAFKNLKRLFKGKQKKAKFADNLLVGDIEGFDEICQAKQ